MLGGGVVGSEMAQASRRLGSEEVTIVEQADRLQFQEEPFAGAELADALITQGITVRTGVRAERAMRPSPDGPVTLVLDDGTELAADELLAGRSSVTRPDDDRFHPESTIVIQGIAFRGIVIRADHHRASPGTRKGSRCSPRRTAPGS